MGDRDEALELLKGMRAPYLERLRISLGDFGAHKRLDALNTAIEALERQRAADKFYQALGWMHAECCAAIDRGEDPRNLDCTDMVARCQRDLAAAPEANDG